jgi:hypothetical protein
MSPKAVLLAVLLFLQAAFLPSRAEARCWFWQQCEGAREADQPERVSPMDNGEPTPALPLRKPSVPSKPDRRLVSGRAGGSEMSVTQTHPAGEAPSRGEKANQGPVGAGASSGFTATPGVQSAYEAAPKRQDTAPAEHSSELSGPATTGNLSEPSVLLNQGSLLAPEGAGGNEIPATTAHPAAEVPPRGEKTNLEVIGVGGSPDLISTPAAQSDHESVPQPPDTAPAEPNIELSSPAITGDSSSVDSVPADLSDPAALGPSDSPTAPYSLPGISYTTITIE